MRKWVVFGAVLVMLIALAGGGSAMAQTPVVDGVWLGTLTVGQPRSGCKCIWKKEALFVCSIAWIRRHSEFLAAT
jgi:hypothetical protein